MYLSKIRLTHVRQFESQEFTFRPGFNLIVGENGAGKSTLLRALLSVLGDSSGRRGASLSDEDIRLKSRELRVEALIEDAGGMPSMPIYVKSWGERARTKGRQADLLTLCYGSNEATCGSFIGRTAKKSSIRQEPELFREEEWLYDEYRRESSSSRSRKSSGFGRTSRIRRFVLNVLMDFSPKFRDFTWNFQPYAFSLQTAQNGRSKDPIIEPRQWELTSAILRNIEELKRPIGWPDERRLIINSLGEIEGVSPKRFHIRGWREVMDSLRTEFRWTRESETLKFEVRLTPRIQVRGEEGNFSLTQLSDGEKRLFSLFVDIARQLSIRSDTSTFEHVPAIVLIDEIDVHLHPRWQRAILPSLERLFPSCQFIATTHSPFVIQAASDGNIVRIRRSKTDSPDSSGQSIEDIIEEVQGIDMPQRSIRYEDMSKAAENYFRLLALGDNVSKEELVQAERVYRIAAEPFATQPALFALLKLEAIKAKAL